jgi:hypothetical protein
MLNFVSVFRLPGKPYPINARPFAEIQRSVLIFRFFTSDICRIQSFGADAVFALKIQEFRFPVHEYQSEYHVNP